MYACAGIFWTLGGPGFPFGAADLGGQDNGQLLAAATPQTSGPVIAALGIIGAIVGWGMTRRHRAMRPLLLGFGWSVAFMLILVLPEARAIKFLPPLGLLAFLRPPDPSSWHFLALMIAGAVWAAATIAYQRATRDACAHCGRDESVRDSRYARAGRIATYVAILAPFGYAGTRILWALDIPIGISPEFLAAINAANPGNTTKILELTLAGLAIGGSLLTVGLLRPWGEVFPRWLPWLAGKWVPLAFPTIFAGLAAVNLSAFGISMVPGCIAFLAGDTQVAGFQMGPLWLLPPIAILVWGISLGLATLAYHRRRRPTCAHCRRS